MRNVTKECAGGSFKRCNEHPLGMCIKQQVDGQGTDTWERKWMNPEVQTTSLNTYPPKLIATILKALREQINESETLNAVDAREGNDAERVQVRCAQWMMRTVFT